MIIGNTVHQSSDHWTLIASSFEYMLCICFKLEAREGVMPGD